MSSSLPAIGLYTHGEALCPEALLVKFRELLVARLRHRPPLPVRLPGDPRRPLHGHVGDGPPQPPHHPVDWVPVVVQDYVPGRLGAGLAPGAGPFKASCSRCTHVASILPRLQGSRTLTPAFGRGPSGGSGPTFPALCPRAGRSPLFPASSHSRRRRTLGIRRGLCSSLAGYRSSPSSASMYASEKVGNW